MARSTKFLFPFASLGLLGALAGCGDDPVPAGTDAGTTPGTDVPATPQDAGEARTYDYVINRLLLDEGAEPGVTTRAFYGFNLDGRNSPSRTASQQAADCSHGDYFSTVDPDQNMGTCTAGMAGGGAACQGGVDNQLPNVAQTIMQFQASLNVQNTLNEQVDTGKFLIMVRISGVNGTLGPALNDPAVEVSVYPYAYAAFPNCANIQMANQMYQIDNRSLTTPGDLSSARLKFQGSIVNGRLRVNPPAANPTMPNFSIPLSLQAISLVIPVFNEEESLPALFEALDAACPAAAARRGRAGRRRLTRPLLRAPARRRGHAPVAPRRALPAQLRPDRRHRRGHRPLPRPHHRRPRRRPAERPRRTSPLLARLDEGFDVVSGWRRDRKDKAVTRRLPSVIANWLIGYVTGVRIHDYGCTLKAYRRWVLEPYGLYGEMHRFIPIYASWAGARVTEMEVTHHPRVAGRASTASAASSRCCSTCSR
jgi:hypothetical protein